MSRANSSLIAFEFNFCDKDDIQNRRNRFIGQANNVLCFFGKLDLSAKIKLFQSYCSSIYGCELWSLDNDNIESFCCAWRNALRRVLGLPNNSHCYLLPILTDTLPIFDEILKRSVNFIISCLNARSKLVRSVAWYAVNCAKHHSILGKNVMYFSQYFHYKFDEFLSTRINPSFFVNFNLARLSEPEIISANFLLELLGLKEGSVIFNPHHFFLTKPELEFLICEISCS
jgi:hypothetical protein